MEAAASTADQTGRPIPAVDGVVDTSTLAGRITFLYKKKLRDETDYEHREAIRRAGGDTSIPRAKRLWKLDEVAEAIGSTGSYFSRIMRGKSINPGVVWCQKVAKFYGVSVSYLIEGATTTADHAFEEALAVNHLAVTEAPQPRPIADRLNDLFAIVRSENGGAEYTNDEVAKKVDTTPEVIAGIRAGTVTEDDISLALAKRLSCTFGAPKDYLSVSDDDPLVEEVDHQLAMLRELSDTGLMEMALKAKRAEGSEGIYELFHRMGELILHMNSVSLEAGTPQAQ
jgi:transcriptional regulator with XRE-family HTH domain